MPSDVRIDRDGAGAAESFDPQIAHHGKRIYVVWSDDRNGAGDIYFNRSPDGGATWLSTDLRLDTDGAGAADSRAPQLYVDGETVVVAWTDGRNGLGDVYANRSADGGATWLAADLRLDTDRPGAGASKGLRIAGSGGSVYAVWEDERNGEADVYASSSTDGGLTWQASDTRLDTNQPGNTSSTSPRVCASADNVYVVWTDNRRGPDDVYFNGSSDRGASWLGSDVKLDAASTGSDDSDAPSLCCSGRQRLRGVEPRRPRQPSATAELGRRRPHWQAAPMPLATSAPGAGSADSPGGQLPRRQLVRRVQDTRSGGSDIYFNCNVPR